MKREEFEQLASSFLYGEIQDDDRKKLETWLQNHPEDQQELNEMQNVLSCLDQVKTGPQSAEPLHLYDITGLPKPSINWKRWITAAAACIALVFCISQGVVVQIGTARIAVGPTLESKEQSSANKEEDPIPNLLETVQSLQKTNEQILLHQASLKNGLITLSNEQSRFQTDLALYNKQQFKQFANEFVGVMDKKLRFLYPISNVPIEFVHTNHSESTQ